MKIKLLLEYDGTEFAGWQRQIQESTVQEELEQALETYFSSLAKQNELTIPEKVSITASGRTDAGVHAAGQVASFPWPTQLPFSAERFCAAMNGITPKGVAVLGAEEVDASFDARRSPHRKCYSYLICNRRSAPILQAKRSWHVSGPLDVAAMIEAARVFVGTHDFSSFRAADCGAATSVRTIRSSQFVRLDAALLEYRIQGTGFLKQMVRTLVGTLVEVGRGTLAPDELGQVLQAKDRGRAGVTAPAKGLTLEWVRYE